MIIGIDPGSVSAAYGVLSASGKLVEAGDIPVVDRQVDAAGVRRLLARWPLGVAVIEQVAAMPKQGVASTFRFGMGCGILRACIVCAGLPLHQVTPGKWKKAMGLDSDAEKSRALAIRLWPEGDAFARKKDHGRAEAALLAEWYRRTQ